MGRLTQVNRRIKAKLKELDQDRVERVRAHKTVQRRNARLEDLHEELRQARKRIQRRRRVVAEIKAELEAAEAESPDTDTAEEAELRERLDQLSGEYDEAVTLRDRILDRIDRVAEKSAEARKTLDKALEESREDRTALKRLRAKRRRIKERRDRPSPHFAFAEFDCNDGTPLPKQSEAAVRHWCEHIGEPLRKRFGAVHINSAFRHRAYNAHIGGEDNSVHIYDFPGRDYEAAAVDVKCERGTPEEWHAFTAGKADGRGRYSTFHHADNRNRIGWADASWSG